MTASAFASLPLEPFLVLVCVDKATASHDLIAPPGMPAAGQRHVLAGRVARWL